MKTLSDNNNVCKIVSKCLVFLYKEKMWNIESKVLVVDRVKEEAQLYFGLSSYLGPTP